LPYKKNIDGYLQLKEKGIAIYFAFIIITVVVGCRVLL